MMGIRLSESVYILKIEMAPFPERLDVGWERLRGVKDNFGIFGLDKRSWPQLRWERQWWYKFGG